jgi:superfamily I DNA/RNA helicase
LFEELLPNIKPFVPDYAEIIERLEELDCEQKTMHLIIDEGQDMPPKFYESLMVMGIKNVFVVADQNQQITDHNSSRKELALLLNKRNSEVVELNKNYRNSYPIAKLAAHFYSDISSPPPGLPKPSAIDIDTPVLFNGNRLESFIKKILIEADMYPDRLIGVVVAKDEIREIWHSELINNDIERDNPKPNINTYSHNRKNPEIDFGEGGIVVLNDASVKGLEFDTVYVILEGFKIFNNDEISIRKRFYVITSRAIEKLVFFDNKDKPNPAASILPKDENILKREVV